MSMIGFLGDLFNIFLLQPVLNLLVLVLRGIEILSIPGELGWAIILTTLIIKFVTWPFSRAQIKSMAKMAELKPDLDKLRAKHKDDRQAFAQAQINLFKERGVNPAGGCLPALVPILFFIPFYQAIDAYLIGEGGLQKINHFLYPFLEDVKSLPDPHFLGINLAAKPQDFLSQGWVLLLIPLISGVSQFILSKMMTPKSVKVYPSDSSKEKKEKKASEDMQEAMQNQMSFTMPIVFAFISFTFSVGLSLYIIALNLVSIWQQYLVAGWGGLGSLKFKVKS